MIGGDKSIWTFILGYLVIPAVIFGRNQEITCDSHGFGQKEGEGMGLQLKPAAGDGDSWAVFPDDSLLSASPELCNTARTSWLGYTDSETIHGIK